MPYLTDEVDSQVVKRADVLAHDISIGVAAIALLLAMGWGGLSPSVKIALAGLPPIALAAWRFLLGWLVVFVGARWERAEVRMKPHERRPLLLLSCLWVTQIIALNCGARFSVASHQAVLMSTYPIWVAVIAHFLIRNDRLTPAKAFGLLVALLGVVAVYFDRLAAQHGGASVQAGDLLILLSAFLLGCIMVSNKLLTQRMSPYKVLTWQMSLGVPAFFALSAWLEGFAYRLSLPVLTALLYQGIIVAGVCFVVQIHLLRKHPASKLSAFGLTTPLWGVTFSHLLLDDPLSRNLLLGGALVVAGIALANRGR